MLKRGSSFLKVKSDDKEQANGGKEILLSDIIISILPFTRYIFKKFPWLAQFVNFSVVGVINLILSYLLYVFFVWIGFHHQLANQLAFWISVLNGYILNRFWVFKRQAVSKSGTQTLRYFSVYGFNMLLGVILLYLYVDILQINEYFAPLISIPLTVPLNYCLNRFWVFKSKVKK